jgi:hypothetical protein
MSIDARNAKANTVAVELHYAPNTQLETIGRRHCHMIYYSY